MAGKVEDGLGPLLLPILVTSHELWMKGSPFSTEAVVLSIFSFPIDSSSYGAEECFDEFVVCSFSDIIPEFVCSILKKRDFDMAYITFIKQPYFTTIGYDQI